MSMAPIRWRAHDVMNSRVMVTTRSARGRDLAIQLLSGVSTGIPVVELNGSVVGIVTEFDLLKAVQEGKNLEEVEAGQIMTECPVCVEEDAPAEEVIGKMIEYRIIRIPVVRENKLVGMIARADILSHVLEPELIGFVN
jgi:CBS domain-containing protein